MLTNYVQNSSALTNNSLLSTQHKKAVNIPNSSLLSKTSSGHFSLMSKIYNIKWNLFIILLFIILIFLAIYFCKFLNYKNKIKKNFLKFYKE